MITLMDQDVFDDLRFHWGKHGSHWKINRNNQRCIQVVNGGTNSMYSVETFNSRQYNKVQFDLRITKTAVYSNMNIGIVNNMSHTGTHFSQKEINSNQSNATTKNIYYSVRGYSGHKCSYMTDHSWTTWTQNQDLSSWKAGDTVSFLIDFDRLAISYFKNGQNIRDTNNDQMCDKIDEKYLKNINFRFAVSSGRVGDCIELLSCKGIKRNDYNYNHNNERVGMVAESKQQEKSKVHVHSDSELPQTNDDELSKGNIFEAILENNKNHLNFTYLNTQMEKYNIFKNGDYKQHHIDYCMKLGGKLIDIGMSNMAATDNLNDNVYIELIVGCIVLMELHSWQQSKESNKQIEHIKNCVRDDQDTEYLYDTHRAIDSDIKQLNTWMDKKEEQMKGIRFDDFSIDYPKSIEFFQNNQNNNDLDYVTTTVAQTFQKRLQCNKQIVQLESQLKDQRRKFNQVRNKLQQQQIESEKLSQQIQKDLNHYLAVLEDKKPLQEKHEYLENKCEIDENAIANQRKLKDKCELLLNKCKEFREKSEQYE